MFRATLLLGLALGNQRDHYRQNQQFQHHRPHHEPVQPTSGAGASEVIIVDPYVAPVDGPAPMIPIGGDDTDSTQDFLQNHPLVEEIMEEMEDVAENVEERMEGVREFEENLEERAETARENLLEEFSTGLLLPEDHMDQDVLDGVTIPIPEEPEPVMADEAEWSEMRFGGDAETEQDEPVMVGTNGGGVWRYDPAITETEDVDTVPVVGRDGEGEEQMDLQEEEQRIQRPNSLAPGHSLVTYDSDAPRERPTGEETDVGDEADKEMQDDAEPVMVGQDGAGIWQFDPSIESEENKSSGEDEPVMVGQDGAGIWQFDPSQEDDKSGEDAEPVMVGEDGAGIWHFDPSQEDDKSGEDAEPVMVGEDGAGIWRFDPSQEDDKSSEDAEPVMVGEDGAGIWHFDPSQEDDKSSEDAEPVMVGQDGAGIWHFDPSQEEDDDKSSEDAPEMVGQDGAGIWNFDPSREDDDDKSGSGEDEPEMLGEDGAGTWKFDPSREDDSSDDKPEMVGEDGEGTWKFDPDQQKEVGWEIDVEWTKEWSKESSKEGANMDSEELYDEESYYRMSWRFFMASLLLLTGFTVICCHVCRKRRRTRYSGVLMSNEFEARSSEDDPTLQAGTWAQLPGGDDRQLRNTDGLVNIV